MHRRGSSGDAEWHGSGRLGEAPFMSVASVESETATKGGQVTQFCSATLCCRDSFVSQRSIISLGTATAGEYKIFVVKPQESENFPRRCIMDLTCHDCTIFHITLCHLTLLHSCSISILASGNDESDSLSLGRVQVVLSLSCCPPIASGYLVFIC